MIETIIAIFALVAGAAIGWFVEHKKVVAQQQLLSQAHAEHVRLETLLTAAQQQYNAEVEQLKAQQADALSELKTQHVNALAELKAQQVNAIEQEKAYAANILQREKEAAVRREELLNENFKKEKALLIRLNDEMKQSEAEMKERVEMLKKEFENVANKVLDEKQLSLKSGNKEQMESIIAPLKQNLEHLNKSLEDSRIQNATNKQSMEDAIKGLCSQTEKLGGDAEKLANALKSNTKVQGDWGEMILERILEESGLRKDEEYFIQKNFTTEEGANVRPDVIVKFPEKRSVIIDSKTSLTAYVRYINATTDEERRTACREHIISVRKHVDELAEKDYTKDVKESFGYVLMFIPNEGSYIVAQEEDKDLIHYAYKRNIIIDNPTNLMMALQLAHNLWQSERQSRNVEEVIRQAGLLYDKTVTLVENLESLGNKLSGAQKEFETVTKILSTGKGNLLSRVENLRSLGVQPKKQISAKSLELADE